MSPFDEHHFEAIAIRRERREARFALWANAIAAVAALAGALVSPTLVTDGAALVWGGLAIRAWRRVRRIDPPRARALRLPAKGRERS
jgi:hypothetical protein